jgi:tumor protein p53-inducible protein 3
LDALGLEGRWILYGLMSGNKVENFNLALLLGKRIELISTTLRARSDNFKDKLVSSFNDEILPLIASGKLRPFISKSWKVKWEDAA